MTTEIIEQSVVEKSAMIFSENANALVIKNNNDRGYAEDMIQGAKTLEDQIFEYLDPPRAKAYEQYQFHKKRLDDAINPVKEGRKIVKQKCIAYDDEQERIRREAQRKADEEARKRAEEEALAAAVQAEQEGDKEAAEQILSAPVEAPPVIVPKTAPAASRLSAGREVWSAQVTSLMELVKAVAAGKVPVTLIQANETALNQMSRALKSSMNVPGVKAVMKKV